MEPDEIRKALARQIEAEVERGISVWTDPEWNAAALKFLGGDSLGQKAGPAGRAAGPAAAGGAAAAPAAQSRPAGAAPAPPATRVHPAPPAPHARVQPAGTPPPPSARAQSAPARPAAKHPFAPPPPALDRDPDWAEQLARVAAEARGCTKCPLHESRTHVVVDSGTGSVPLVFIGEAPGADEDAQGEAFVGRAGQLLTRIIAAIGLDRKDVYICNVLKCRPPGNRNPLPEEIDACRPYLEQQVAILKPRVICALGLIATQLLLESKAPIGKLRGRLFRYRGIPLLPTYHPAALLRNPNLKRTVWEDMQVLRKVLDEGPPARTKIEDVPEKIARPPQAESGNLFS